MIQRSIDAGRAAGLHPRPTYRVRHMSRGRVRLYLPGLRRRPADALFLEQAFGRLGGIRDVRASAVTGTVLVTWDPARAGLADVIALLHRLPAPTVTTAAPAALTVRRAAGGREPLPRALRWQILGVVATGAILGLLVFQGFLARFVPVIGPLLGRLPAGRIASVVAVLAGIPVFREGAEDMLEHRRLSLDFLVSVAAVIGIAIGEGIVALEALWLVNCGTVLEEYTAERSRRSIRGLLEVGEERAWLERGGRVVRVPLDQVAPGDVVVVHAGEKLGVDGEVLSGEAAVNEAPITGESIPAEKAAGARVFAGTLVDRGTLRIRAGQVGDTTYLARVLHMVEESLETRAPIERVSDRFAAWFVPSAFLISLLVFALTRNFYRAFTVLVTSCPCAAAIATPTAVSAAVGNAARRNMLVKGGMYIEQASRIDTVCLDKTGTLTAGRPRVVTVLPGAGMGSPDDLVALAASAEMRSSHPLAQALLEAAEAHGAALVEPGSFETVAGSGVAAELSDGRQVLVGSARLMAAHGVAPDGVDADAERMRAAGETLLYVARDGALAGLIGVLDGPRPEAGWVVHALQSAGLELHLVTGDHRGTADAIGRQLGIPVRRHDMLPEDKAAYVDDLRARGRCVAMVGDGINDALALARSDMGVAMGAGGSDVAVATADVALPGDDLTRLPALVDLSHRTMAVIRQNYVFSMGVNALGIGLGSAGLISPLVGGLFHVANSLGVILNSSRLLLLTDRNGARPAGPALPAPATP